VAFVGKLVSLVAWRNQPKLRRRKRRMRTSTATQTCASTGAASIVPQRVIVQCVENSSALSTTGGRASNKESHHWKRRFFFYGGTFPSDWSKVAITTTIAILRLSVALFCGVDLSHGRFIGPGNRDEKWNPQWEAHTNG